MIHFYNKENENDFAGSVNLLFGATVFYYICQKKKYHLQISSKYM